MSWFYADWTWVQSLKMTAVVVATVGVVLWAVVNVVRAAVSARHDDVLVTNGFVPPSPTELERRRHAPHHRNGWRAA